MSRAILEFKLKVKYLYCSTCQKRPIDFSQKNVDKFLKEHALHATKFNEFPTLVGYLQSGGKHLKNKKVTVRFIDIQEKHLDCKYKKCENYKKGTEGFCNKKCYEKYKRRHK